MDANKSYADLFYEQLLAAVLLSQIWPGLWFKVKLLVCCKLTLTSNRSRSSCQSSPLFFATRVWFESQVVGLQLCHLAHGGIGHSVFLNGLWVLEVGINRDVRWLWSGHSVDLSLSKLVLLLLFSRQFPDIMIMQSDVQIFNHTMYSMTPFYSCYISAY